MLPVMEGVIRRRVLLNFRVKPDLVAPLLPPPIEVLPYNGWAIVGVCLIGMEQLRPKGLPGRFGLSSENMAHRVAIRYPTGAGMHDGVFIWRRETDECLVSLLGGRLFPGVHQRADFAITETRAGLSIDVKTVGGQADVGFEAEYATGWAPGSVFGAFEDAAEFFRRGDCGFSCGLRAGKLDGLQLKTLRWNMSPLRIGRLETAFFHDARRFPSGAAQFDCALLMRGVPHEWHEIGDIPEMAGAFEK
jgi:hypothetical protein